MAKQDRARLGESCAAALKNERGQALVLTAVTMVGFLAVLALVLDVGNWFGNDRILQRGADAAALAGATKLAMTGDPAQAATAASANAATNNAAVEAGYPTVSGSVVRVRVIKSKTKLAQAMVPTAAQHDRHANAAAAAYGIVEAQGVVPLVVYVGDVGSFGTSKTLTYTKDLPDVGPGNFGSVDTCGAGSPGQVSQDWPDGCITNPACVADQSCLVHLSDTYEGVTGAGNMKKVVDAVAENWMNQDIVLPIYDTGSGTGSNFEYHIVGFGVFHLTDASTSGNHGSITGYFTQTIPVGGVGDPGQTNFGASAVYLVQF